MSTPLVTARLRLEEIVAMIRAYWALEGGKADSESWQEKFKTPLKEICGEDLEGMYDMHQRLERELALRHAEYTLAAHAHILEPIRDAEVEWTENVYRCSKTDVAENIVWRGLPDWYFAITANKNGDWYVHSKMPTLCNDGWYVCTREGKSEKIIIGPEKWDGFTWQDSLIKRP